MRFANENLSHRKYLKSFEALGRLSKRTGINPATLGQMIIEEKRPEIEKYVKNAGLIPEKNPVKLAVQTTLIHQNRVAEKMRKFNLPLQEAEIKVFHDEDIRSYTGESENFAPMLLGVIASVGGKGISAINEKRTATGKKPILSGKFWTGLKDKLKGVTVGQTEGGGLNVDIAGRPQGAPTSELGIGVSAMQDQLIKEGQKSWLLKNKYWLIVGIIVLIGGAYFLLKKK